MSKMPYGLALLFVIVGLLSGCSFIQSWSDYRPDDEGMDGGVDAGAFDAGDFDAGDFDAGDFDAGECNLCTFEGCGTGSPECQYDSDDECFYCVFDDLPEGNNCSDDAECAGSLICELGLCLTACADSDACADSFVGTVCASGSARSVCFDHECDPVSGVGCAGDERCFVSFNVEDATEVASVCSLPEGSFVGEGEACNPPSLSCEHGQICLIGSDGMQACHALCYVDDGCTDATQDCYQIGSPGPTYETREVGACGPMLCSIDSECGAGERCSQSECRTVCDPGMPDCPTHSSCVDPDGSGFVCLPQIVTCMSNPDCPAWTHVCESGICVEPCSDDAFCNSISYDRCVSTGTGEACRLTCEGGASCPAGLTCADPDGDGLPECVI